MTLLATDTEPAAGLSPADPLDQTDPELAESIRKVANGEHPTVRGFAASGAGVKLFLHHAVTQGVGRNDPCPCGSGKKYKKCCLC